MKATTTTRLAKSVVVMPVSAREVDPILEQEYEIASAKEGWRQEYKAFHSRAVALEHITSGEQLREAEALAKEIQGLKKRVQGAYKPIVDFYNRQHKKWTADRGGVCTPVSQLFNYVKESMGLYLKEQDRLKREAQAAALAAKPETQTAFMPGLVRPADTQLSSAAAIPRWKFEVEDMLKIAAAVVDGTIPVEAIQLNESFVRQQVNMYGEALRYPGLKVEPDVSISIR